MEDRCPTFSFSIDRSLIWLGVLVFGIVIGAFFFIVWVPPEPSSSSPNGGQETAILFAIAAIVFLSIAGSTLGAAVLGEVRVYGDIVRTVDGRGRVRLHRMEHLQQAEQVDPTRHTDGGLILYFPGEKVTLLSSSSVRGHDRSEFMRLVDYSAAKVAANKGAKDVHEMWWSCEKTRDATALLYLVLGVSGVAGLILTVTGPDGFGRTLAAILAGLGIGLPLWFIPQLRRRRRLSEEHLRIEAGLVTHTDAEGVTRTFALDDLVEVRQSTLVFPDHQIRVPNKEPLKAGKSFTDDPASKLMNHAYRHYRQRPAEDRPSSPFFEPSPYEFDSVSKPF